jgi:hypothetical protein
VGRDLRSTGQAYSVQFELYALSKKLPVSEGFQAATAESEVTEHKLVLDSTAVSQGG